MFHSCLMQATTVPRAERYVTQDCKSSRSCSANRDLEEAGTALDYQSY